MCLSLSDADEPFIHWLFAQTVALGYSCFCSLFTQSEWEGLEHALDTYFYYVYGPSARTAHALGPGMSSSSSRGSRTPIKEYRMSTNARGSRELLRD